MRLGALADTPVFTCEVVDATGMVTAMFYGRRDIRGVQAGSLLRLQGRVTVREGRHTLANPAYTLLPREQD